MSHEDIKRKWEIIYRHFYLFKTAIKLLNNNEELKKKLDEIEEILEQAGRHA